LNFLFQLYIFQWESANDLEKSANDLEKTSHIIYTTVNKEKNFNPPHPQNVIYFQKNINRRYLPELVKQSGMQESGMARRVSHTHYR
jgi:hypothetical protein